MKLVPTALASIVDTVLSRKDAGYKNRSHSDDEHVALVIEGGGMRGVAVGGMVSAIEDLGLTHCFDSIHGSSAGAAAGAYLACGQANFGTRMFYEDLTDNRFINLSRSARGQPIMDSDHLVDHVMTRVKPLDFDRLKDGPTLNIVVTDIDLGESVVFSDFASYDAYRSCLKASVCIPIIAGRPREINGRRLVDGGMIQQIALPSALAAGATKVLALQTRRADEKIRAEGSFATKLQATAMQTRFGGRIGEIYLKRNARINQAVRQLNSGVGPDGQTLVGLNIPSSVKDVHRLTKDAKVLKDAAEVSRQMVLDLVAQHRSSP